MAIKNVALLGADGTLGPFVYRSLVENGFNVTVLKRASSKSTSAFPSEIKVPDDFPSDSLIDTLRGKDAVVVTIKGSEAAIQKRLADACVKAGVRRFIPADFGSVDSSSPTTQELVPLYSAKTSVREYLKDLAAAHPAFSWTSIVPGHFIDSSVLEFLHLSISDRRAEILDDGETKASATTLSRIGEATARILSHAGGGKDVGRNGIVYIQSFCVTQNQIIAAFERATSAVGGEDKTSTTTAAWEVDKIDSKTYRTEQKKRADAGDREATENLVWYLGAMEANWETRDGFANKALGFEDEDLDTVVQGIVKELEK